MRRRVVCPRSHPASLHVWRPSAPQTSGSQYLPGGATPRTPPELPSGGLGLGSLLRGRFLRVRIYLEGRGVESGDGRGQLFAAFGGPRDVTRSPPGRSVTLVGPRRPRPGGGPAPRGGGAAAGEKAARGRPGDF